MIELLNSNAGAVQGIATVVLVVVTIYYAISTKIIAAETKDMATATEHMTELTRQQRLDSTRPVLGFNTDQQHTYRQLRIEVANVGVGPALDVHVEMLDSPLQFHTAQMRVSPFVLPVQDMVEVGYVVHSDTPFVDESLPRWPRNAEDEEALSRQQAPFEGGSMGIAKHQAAEEEVRERRVQFKREVDELAYQLPYLGTLRATYRDVHGRTFVSEARLVHVGKDSDGYAKSLAFEGLTLRDPAEGFSREVRTR